MSIRRIGNTKTLPPNPKWVELPRSDGDRSQWPKNTERVVDHEGCVNFMRPIDIDEAVSITWRVAAGKMIAQTLKLDDAQNYVLKCFPSGYQMYDHNKGTAGAPRHDPYLFGSINALRFRSANEFAPHAVWLATDPTLNRSNCECKYCTKKPQREISQQLGLTKRAAASPSPSGLRPAREKRVVPPREPKPPHAGVRKAPKPPKPHLPSPKVWLVPDKNNDIRDALAIHEVKAIRYFRKGELVWCALNPPIYLPSGSLGSITYWPGLVDVVTTKPIITPRPADTDAQMHNVDANIPSPTEEDGSVGPSNPTKPQITWSIRQNNAYKIKLLNTSTSIILSEDEVLPYLAYAPDEHLLRALGTVLPDALESADKESDGTEGRILDVNPLQVDPRDASEYDRFKRVVIPYSLAIQMASNIARFWTPTDEWEFKFAIPATAPSTPDAPVPSLHSLITSAMASNGQPPHISGPSGTSSEELQNLTTRILGQASQPPANSKTVSQLRYQGLWWGAERIWTEELVRLKLARCQFAPQGTDTVYPPGGPSKSTIEWARDNNIELDGQTAGAGEKSLFMRVEGLFVVDVPSPGETGMIKECRASGMLYELVEEDWEESDSVIKNTTDEDKGKGKEPTHPVGITDAHTGPIDQVVDIGSASTGPLQSQIPAPFTLNPPDGLSATPPRQVSQTPPLPVKEDTLSRQLSRPVLSTAYPLPEPPKGYKFRAILPPGNEVVLSLSLIAGRYYPRLFSHPLLMPVMQQAMQAPPEEGGLYLYRHLWALEGLVPGIHQTMDPEHWKNGRHIMFKEADSQARQALHARRKEIQMERPNSQAGPSSSGFAPASSASALFDDPMDASMDGNSGHLPAGPSASVSVSTYT